MNANINTGVAKIYDSARFLAEVLYELQFGQDLQTGVTSITGVIDVLRGEQFFALDSVLQLEIEDGRTFEVTVGWKDEWTGRYYVRGSEIQDKSSSSHPTSGPHSDLDSPGKSIVY
jgi:hypothetical protein